jgi:hypothetical protein
MLTQDHPDINLHARDQRKACRVPANRTARIEWLPRPNSKSATPAPAFNRPGPGAIAQEQPVHHAVPRVSVRNSP